MAAKKGLNPEMAPLEEKGIITEAAIPLTLDERMRLRAILTDPVFVKAWRNAQISAPGPLLGQLVLNSALGSIAANNRLHEMRGWLMLRAALVGQVSAPPIQRPQVAENYPEGSDAIVKASAKKVPPPKPLFPKV